MSDVQIRSLTVPLDAVATVPVILLDQLGRPCAPDAAISLVSSDPAIFSATLGTTDSDQPYALVTPIAPGSATLSFSDGAASVSLDIQVVTPAPTSASFGAASFGPKA